MKLVCLIIFCAGLCHGVSEATECTARGRFPNNDAEGCRGYTMCLLGGAAGFTQYKLNCPATFIYSHLEQQCTNATNYQCLPTYQCNVTGNFENPSSKNCSSYVACLEGISGIVTARQVECPTGEVFDPVTATCANNASYECPASVVKTAEIVTEPAVVTTMSVPHNTTYNVFVSSENGFQLSGSGSVNSAVDICSKHAVWFPLLIFVNFLGMGIIG